MKKYSFSINGVNYDVDIQSVDGNNAHLEVNGKPYDVEIHKDAEQAKAPVIPQPKVKEKELLPKKEIAQQKEAVTMVKKEPEAVVKKPASHGAKIEVKSPLPGIIVEIFVNKGDTVKKNQKLFSLEAMKMENEIKAEKDGVVESIKVTAGQAVLQEEVVMELN
ncbi:MAG TPA: biotin/lipoyl-binding protein [Bacteroidales bacterium]|nr:biotin/lipoyl-binding protein [Bacteroidales bacterium]HPT21781.1 biotin/lipoyl-binding protein [Bacteroidales bacterium]